MNDLRLDAVGNQSAVVDRRVVIAGDGVNGSPRIAEMRVELASGFDVRRAYLVDDVPRGDDGVRPRRERNSVVARRLSASLEVDIAEDEKTHCRSFTTGIDKRSRHS